FKEQSFRIGLHLLTGRAEPAAAGRAYTTLADAAIESLAPAALKEAQRQGGRLSGGAVAVVALGKAGSREMTAGSDLDLMTLYEAPADVVTTGKAWSAEVFYIRFTQRLISALSAHTAEGGLYEVDMRLRPTGSKGPVSVRLSGFDHYYAADADTWEFMVLTRARVVWSSRQDFGRKVEKAIEAALRRPRPDADMAGDVKKMRALMDRERPGRGFWDMKLVPGGQVDAEFAAQYGQLIAAAAGEPLTVSTLEALKGRPVLQDAWSTQQALSQVLKAAFDGDVDPDHEPAALQARLAEAVGAPDYATLKTRLATLRVRARAALEATLSQRERA
ncbi:MAG: glutamine-synthetase adenylyltransferase, partial [Brevundimonas sp.]